MAPSTSMSLAALCLVALAGCSSADQSEPSAAQAEESAFDPMTSTIDRAQGVDDLMNQRMDDLDKRLEESEGN